MVRLKVPDIFQRAKILMEKEAAGLSSDAFVRSKMEEIAEAERVRAGRLQELARHRETYEKVTKPRKERILHQYRILRKQFKDRSSPLLRQLDLLDEREQLERRHLMRALQQARKAKREATRAIGLHNIEPSRHPFLEPELRE